MDAIEGGSDERADELPLAKPLDKIIVALAGPAASMGLALVFACVVFVVGRPVSESENTNVIGYVVEGGPAAKAGLQAGDRILSVNGHRITRISGMGRMSDTLAWNVATSDAPVIPIRFERHGKEQTVEVEPYVEPSSGWRRKNLRQIQVAPAMTPMIARVIPNSPAEEAGLKSGDLVVAADGQKLFSPIPLAELLSAKKGVNTPGSSAASVTLTIRRGGKKGADFTSTITPRIPDGQTVPRLAPKAAFPDQGESFDDVGDHLGGYGAAF